MRTGALCCLAIALLLTMTMPALAQTLFNNGNVQAVRNQPTRDTSFTLTRATRITRITTYHYNGGQGAPAGTIALRSRSGDLYGPWSARVENRTYWVVTPDTVLPSGTYRIEDSSPATWAQNAGSGGAGMAWIDGTAADASTRTGQAPPDVAATRSAPASSAPASTTQPAVTRRVLFDGALGDRWRPHAAAGGHFERDARLESGRGLAVRVPPNNGGANVGLLSPQPLVWLDETGPAASASVTFRFDPEETTGFAVALAVPNFGGVPGNPPGAPNVLLTWARAADGANARLEMHVNPHAAGAFRTVTLPPTAPRTVTLTLRLYEIDWRLDDGEEYIDVFPEARSHQGFNVYVYSLAPAWQAPVSMTLRDVVLSQRHDPVRSRVSPVGNTVLFDGRADPRWEPIGIAGGDFARFARYENGALVVDVPKGSYWGKTGLLSVKPVLHMERGSPVAPYRFALRADPARTTGLVVAFSPARAADMWPSHSVWVSLIQNERGQYELYLHLSAYTFWTRPLPGRWNGQLTILLATDSVSVSVPNGPSIRAPFNGLRENADYYVSIIAHPRQVNEPASLALQRLVRDRAVPAELPAAQRWGLLSPEEFKPDAFIRDLQRDLLSTIVGDSVVKKGAKR